MNSCGNNNARKHHANNRQYYGNPFNTYTTRFYICVHHSGCGDKRPIKTIYCIPTCNFPANEQMITAQNSNSGDSKYRP